MVTLPWNKQQVPRCCIPGFSAEFTLTTRELWVGFSPISVQVTCMNVVAFTVPKYAAYRKPANGKQEVRSAVRFPLRMEVMISTEQGEIQAFTRDVSACGVLFEMAKAIPPDSIIQFTLAMPGAALGLDTDVRIQCHGRVVRSIGDGAKYFTASTIDEYEFV